MRCLCDKEQWKVEIRAVRSKDLKMQSPEKMERVHGSALRKEGRSPFAIYKGSNADRRHSFQLANGPDRYDAFALVELHTTRNEFFPFHGNPVNPFGSTGHLRQIGSTDKKLHPSSVSQKKAIADSHWFNAAFFSLPKFMVRDVKRLLHSKTVINCQ